MIQATTQESIENLVQEGQLICQVTTDTTWDNANVVTHSTWHAPTGSGTYIWAKDDKLSMHYPTYKKFNISTTKPLIDAHLYLAVDNYGSVCINGLPLSVDEPTEDSSNYSQGRYFIFSKEDCEKYFKTGENIITILAFNYPDGGPAADNPAGVYANLEIFA